MRSFLVRLLLPAGAVSAHRGTAPAALELARHLEEQGERVVVTTPDGHTLAPHEFAFACGLA
jgi:hypothetical protein